MIYNDIFWNISINFLPSCKTGDNVVIVSFNALTVSINSNASF